MKIHLAGAEGNADMLRRMNVRNILVSFWNKPNIAELQGFSVFMDSGAFSAFTQNKKIDVDEYCRFIKSNTSTIKTYASLDVIGNPEETYNNHIKMKSYGLEPIPTFHVGEDFKWLQRYINDNEKYIALGGMVPHASKVTELKKWIRQCFSIMPNNIKVHGFGISMPSLIKEFGFYSVDSTSWLYGARYGYFYHYANGDMQCLSKKSFQRRFGKAFNRLSTDTINQWNELQWKQFADYMEMFKNEAV